VDDDRLLRRILTEGLKAEGAECSEAATAADAIRAVLSNPPDICLLDMNLPDLDGLSVLRALVGRPETASTRIYLLTGSEEEDLAQRAVEAGARAVIRKPVTPSLLYRRLRES